MNSRHHTHSDKYRKDRYRRIFSRASIWMLAAALAACASVGNPSGGPRDEEPPRFVGAIPPPGSVNFSGDKVTLEFNELVTVKDPQQRVVVSPSGSATPRVSYSGRKVFVTFPDTLRRNTTYAINFDNAICDNNEGNPLGRFVYTFSTGPTLDSLRISGMVLSAEDGSPLKGKLVGAHVNLADSAFRRIPLKHIARTDDQGRFSIFGLPAATYRVFMIDDADADMRYSSPEEEIAFYPLPVTPSTDFTTALDTTFNLLTGAVDTIVERRRTVFLPNTLLMRSFKSAFKQQYVTKHERQDSTRLNLIFNAPSDYTPQFSLVGAPRLKDWYVAERSQRNDSITLWLKPQSLLSADTLRLDVQYLKRDKNGVESIGNDTLRYVVKHNLRRDAAKAIADKAKQTAAKLKRGEQVDTAPQLLKLSPLTSSTIEMGSPLVIESPVPLILSTLPSCLEEKRDTLWVPLANAPQIAVTDTLKPRRYTLSYPWKYNTSYRLVVDSLATESIYGTPIDALRHEFKTREESEYSSLKFNLTNLDDSIGYIIQLLDRSGKPLRTSLLTPKAEKASVEFTHLLPGTYMARVYEDYNRNGRIDTGDYDTALQPDQSFYYPKFINLKKNWSKEEAWDPYATPLDRQKPREEEKKDGERDDDDSDFGNEPSFGGFGGGQESSMGGGPSSRRPSLR